MTAYALASPAGPFEVRPHAHQARSHVRVGHIHAVQTPAALARRKGIARLALITMVLAALAFVAPGALAGDGAGTTVVHDTYTVAQGETRWSIASSLTAPGEQVRETIAELKELNAMSGSSLQAGEQIVIPALDR